MLTATVLIAVSVVTDYVNRRFVNGALLSAVARLLGFAGIMVLVAGIVTLLVGFAVPPLTADTLCPNGSGAHPAG